VTDETTNRGEDLFAVRVRVTREQARRLVERTDLDFGDRPHIRPQSENVAILEVFASETQIAELKAQGLEVEVGANVSAAGRERQAEVGQGDRFEGGRIPPKGLGTKVTGKGTPRGPRPPRPKAAP
jgi:hypothetical protein